ncbi:unnamed protein product [Heligmosomoides polygyrus]|uniref:S1 motif domain-containing protein n=1 Tax=Heligmosomoides polygyrus TaxID=6339 RepID=A0A183GVG9_HELPZ|nr:unnamed protein product [Heligmosomoides polygyrus]
MLLVCGVISQRVADDCLYVELAGGSGLIGKVAYVDVDGGKDGAAGLQIGQTVLGRISRLNTEKKNFRVSLKLADCVPEQHLPTKGSSPSASVALQLVKSSVEEMLALCELSKVKLPSIGTTVTATVSQIVDDVLFVLFGGKLTGCVREKNYKDGVKVGDKIKCLVVSYVFPRNDAELVMIDSEQPSLLKKKGKKNRSEEASEAASRVVLTRRDYVVVLQNKERLVFVPSRFHPNQVVEIKNGKKPPKSPGQDNFPKSLREAKDDTNTSPKVNLELVYSVYA